MHAFEELINKARAWGLIVIRLLLIIHSCEIIKRGCWFMTHNRGGNEKVGCIFPILRHHVSNLFGKDQPVFVKFTRFKPENCSLIIFYVSGDKLLIGEANVENVERLDPNIVWSRYNDRLFLNQTEYNEYTKISPIGKTKRKIKEITVFELKDPRRYETSIKSIFTVPPSGRYLTQKMVREIRILTELGHA